MYTARVHHQKFTNVSLNRDRDIRSQSLPLTAGISSWRRSSKGLAFENQWGGCGSVTVCIVYTVCIRATGESRLAAPRAVPGAQGFHHSCTRNHNPDHKTFNEEHEPTAPSHLLLWSTDYRQTAKSLAAQKTYGNQNHRTPKRRCVASRIRAGWNGLDRRMSCDSPFSFFLHIVHMVASNTS